MEKKLFIGNLSYDVTDEDLKEAFSQFGEIASASVVKDRDSGRSKGFGFIEFAAEESALKAKEAMNGKNFNGRTIKVDEARAPKQRNRNSGGGYGRRERRW